MLEQAHEASDRAQRFLEVVRRDVAELFQVEIRALQGFGRAQQRLLDDRTNPSR
jgi:hypothetical protein